ncbi:ABC transporter permease [Nonomuraea sp. NBC_00507]|uniref:ABC transporter permease n=1 Tax=Nonomuraea sp. NBC_00507 TaxID=2976002 RepID=UPI002E1819AB
MSELETAPTSTDAARPVATADGARPGSQTSGRLRNVHRTQRSWSVLVLLALITIFSVMRPEQFVSWFNAKSIAVDASSYLLIAVGMTFVITIAGIDLSVGSVLVFSGVVSLKVMLAIGGDGPLVLLAGLAAALLSGVAWGLVNGLVTTRGGVSPLITTLGSFAAATGLAYLLAGGQDMHGVPRTLADTLGFGEFLGVPYTVLVALTVAAAGAFVMSQTRFGRYTAAIGSNEEAVRRAAVNVNNHIVKVYVLSGALAGLSGFVSLARFQTTTLNGHQTDMLQAILAVVIGGTSLIGGVGTVLGTVVGVMIPSVLTDGFVILGLEPFWQQVALGAALVIVVMVDQRRRRRDVRT